MYLWLAKYREHCSKNPLHIEVSRSVRHLSAPVLSSLSFSFSFFFSSPLYSLLVSPHLVPFLLFLSLFVLSCFIFLFLFSPFLSLPLLTRWPKSSLILLMMVQLFYSIGASQVLGLLIRVVWTLPAWSSIDKSCVDSLLLIRPVCSFWALVTQSHW